MPKNGRPTFYTILNNIKECVDLIRITIRVNVDKSNINAVTEVLQILEDNDLKKKGGLLHLSR